jgi:SAM-dependent methyltransferase
MNVFDEMGNYWAEIADKNPTEKQIHFIKNNLKADGYVLDLACGTGRHSIPLSKEGYGMVGLDASLNLLRIAKKRWSQIQLVRGDMRFLPFRSGAFSAVISMDTSFGYLPSVQDDFQSLTELLKTLSQDGTLIVDVFNREHLIRKYRLDKIRSYFVRLKWLPLPFLLKSHNRWLLFRLFKWKEYQSFFLLQKRTVTPSGKWLCDLWVVCDKGKGQIAVFEHAVRLYGQDELEALLEKAGFVVNRVYGGYEGENFNPNSSRLILVADAK